jgi:hypothetical protein
MPFHFGGSVSGMPRRASVRCQLTNKSDFPYQFHELCLGAAWGRLICTAAVARAMTAFVVRARPGLDTFIRWHPGRMTVSLTVCA